MQILKKMATENVNKAFALDKPAFQNKVASKRPVKEIIKGFEKYCRGMARRYLSNPMLEAMASNSPARPLAAIHTISAPSDAKVKASIKERARNILEIVGFRESPLERAMVVEAKRSRRIL